MTASKSKCIDMTRRAWIILLLTVFFAAVARADERGDSVVVVYNSEVPESKGVADHYAAVRHVPTNQIFAVKMPKDEAIWRITYHDQLEEPLRHFLEEQKLLVMEPDAQSVNAGALRVKESRIRYIVLCYGVPLRIGNEFKLVEPGAEKMPELVRRNEAAVDSELSLLPWPNPHRMLSGPQPNPLYAATNAAALNPARGVLMVTRLDGPSAAIARGLVDKAMEAETTGLWGRAYIDLRMTDEPGLKQGDVLMRDCADAAARYGFDTVVDDKPALFSPGFPMSQIALYAGWYASDVFGPFAQRNVEFMPGAFAYHLHSYSAQTIRSTKDHWVGPLLADGVTCTMGCTAEPFLGGTPNIAIFFARFLGGFTFGEAAYACQADLSWQTTVVGDPLYRPFGKDPKMLHEYLTACRSPMLAWSHERVINLSLNHHVEPSKLINYLNSIDITQQSPVLMEKMGDLYLMQGLTNLAIDSWQKAMILNPTPLQAVRLTFDIGDNLAASNREARALETFDSFIKQNPNYPDALEVYQKLDGLAQKLRDSAKVSRYELEIARLTASRR